MFFKYKEINMHLNTIFLSLEATGTYAKFQRFAQVIIFSFTSNM